MNVYIIIMNSALINSITNFPFFLFISYRERYIKLINKLLLHIHIHIKCNKYVIKKYYKRNFSHKIPNIIIY